MHDGDTPRLKSFFRNKIVRVILILDAIIILVVIGILIYRATKVSTIMFSVAPIDATISVNGDTNFSNGRYAISPGKYEISISREGLEAKTMTVDIEPRHFVSIVTFLVDSDKNFNFYKSKENYESYKKLRSIASKDNNSTTDKDDSAQDFIEKYGQILSIWNKLPIKGSVHAESSVSSSTGGFAIRDGRDRKDCNISACLVVNYYGKGYETEVTNQIKKAGYNPDDYQLIYERYN